VSPRRYSIWVGEDVFDGVYRRLAGSRHLNKAALVPLTDF
jgi:hypothetical protein